MGEYAKLVGSGEEVKIGTCENMYYLRFDQRRQVWAQRGNVDPMRDVAEIRFRFPWPDEDSIAPGAFHDAFRRLAVHAPAPEGVTHGHVQFVASQQGYNVCLPCPEGPDALDEIAGYKVHRNGWAGPTFLTQQAVRNGRLVICCECVCGHAWHLPTIEDAEPVIEAIAQQAEARRRMNDETEEPTFHDKVIERIRAGYEMEL